MLTTGELAAQWGVHRSTAHRRARKLGMKFSGRLIIWTPELDAALRELRARGLGFTKCGAALGVAPSAVEGRVHQLGLPVKPRVGGITPAAPVPAGNEPPRARP